MAFFFWLKVLGRHHCQIVGVLAFLQLELVSHHVLLDVEQVVVLLSNYKVILAKLSYLYV